MSQDVPWPWEALKLKTALFFRGVSIRIVFLFLQGERRIWDCTLFLELLVTALVLIEV